MAAAVPRARRVRLPAFAASAIETEALDHRDDDPPDEYQPIRDAWAGGALLVSDANREALRRALVELSNACDELGYERASAISPSEQSFYRRASRSLSTVAWSLRGRR